MKIAAFKGTAREFRNYLNLMILTERQKRILKEVAEREAKDPNNGNRDYVYGVDEGEIKEPREY